MSNKWLKCLIVKGCLKEIHLSFMIVELTEKAIQQCENIAKSNDKTYIRLAVIGGGCSGLNYKIDFDDKKEKDNEEKYEKFSIIIDPKSSIYLKDTVLDFQDGLQGKGFVFTNPNATNTCGCGESFSV